MKKKVKYLAEKPGLQIVLLVVLVLVGGAIFLGLRSSEEMRSIIGKDFNDQQLALARHTASILEQHFRTLKRELQTLGLSPSIQYVESIAWPNRMKIALASVGDYGVFRITLVHRDGTQAYSMNYNQALYVEDVAYGGSELYEWCEKPENKNEVYIGRVQKGLVADSEPGFIMMIASPVYQISPDEAHPLPTQKFAGVLIFHLDAGRLARQLVEPIRSGKTGYGWVIDEAGIFLYHMEEKFVGQNAFEARKFRDPHISFDKINAIQKDRMLKGEEGTSWYISGWHRGTTGTIKKLIAFAPVRIGAANAERIWSVAVAAPTSEVEDNIRAVYVRQAMIQGVFTTAALLLLVFLIVNERTWLKKLELEVEEKTKDLEEYARKLERSQKRYRSLVESADDMIYTLDKNLQVWSMNRTWVRLTGQEIERVIGRGILDVIEYKAPKQVAQAVHDALSLRRPISQEEEVRIGERDYWLDTKYTPFLAHEASLEGFSTVLVIARDITEHKKFEGQLMNTEKMASLGSLAAGIAHEINNPIAIILGFSEVLKDRFAPGSKEKEIVETIERQGDNCRKIVENLLAFARIPQEVCTEMDVADDLQRVINVVKNSLVTQKIDLKINLAEDLPKVKADGRQVEQVFMNIISNAVAAMENGGVLTIRAYRSDGSVKVAFKDTGVGIPRQNMDKIFEPFFTTKEVGKGTGLGLSVSYGIIKKFGGEIEVESQTREESSQPGTTFTIVLPVLSPNGCDQTN